MKVLFINYGYNLFGGVNVLRVRDILRFLSNNGVSVIHLTPEKAFETENVENVVVKPSLPKTTGWRLFYFSFIKSMFSPGDDDEKERWAYDIKNFLEQNEKQFRGVDVIYVNTHPVCLCRAGIFAKEILGAKLAVDFQDSFYFNPYKRILPIFDYFMKRREEEYLKKVDLLITNTPSAEVAYKRAYPGLSVCHVTNMIPSNLPEPRKKMTKNEKLQILYGGSLSIGRDLFPLLNALRQVGRDYSVEVLGDVSGINRFRYRDYPEIDWKGKMKTDEYYNYLNDSADITVILQSFKTKPTGVSCIAAKTYEYLALNKPIIYIGPAGDNADIIKQFSNNFVSITDPSDSSGVIKFLNGFKHQAKNTKSNFYKLYSSKHLCGRILYQLNNLLNDKYES